MEIDFDQFSKYFSGEMSPTEKEAFISALLEDTDRLEEFSRLKNTWAIAGILNKKIGKKIAKKGWHFFNRRKGSMLIWQRAAMILLLVGVTGVMSYFMGTHAHQEEAPITMAYTTLSVPAGQYVQATLPDGSEVWLNSKSTFVYPDRFSSGGAREVHLQGEGFFKVSSDKEHPFIVKTKNMDIVATGTQFNVSAYDDDPHLFATLIEGTVHLHSEQNGISCQMKEGQSAVYQKELNQISLKASNYDEISWTEEEFRFKDISLEDITKRLERYFNITFVFANETLKNKRFTGTFTYHQTVDNIMKALKTSTKQMSYRIENSTVYIY